MPRPRGLALFGALSSGALLVLLFPNPDQGWLAWIALVPLLLAIRSVTPGAAFATAFAAGLVAYGGIMAWIRLFGEPAWVLIVAGMAAFLGGFAALVVSLVRRYDRGGGWAWLWAVPLTWTAVEVVRSVGPVGFPWALLGLTQYRTPAVLSLAPLVGVFGIGTVVALVNASVAEIIAQRRLSRPALLGLGVAVAAMAGSHLYGPGSPAVSRVVAAIQPNIAPRLKGIPSEAAAILDALLRQTQDASTAGAEIIVYPETAVPWDLTTSPEARATIGRTAGGVVVAGMFLPGPQNGVLVLNRDGTPLGGQAKRRLVPFGEAGVRPGTSAEPVPTSAGTIALAICYESAFTDLLRPLVAGGADLLAILTNDGWFGTSAGPPQHAANAVMRAAEFRRTVVRAANTGTSMIILPDGRVVGEQRLGTPGIVVAQVPIGGPVVPYVRWGWLLAPLAVLAWAALSAPIAWRAVQTHRADARRLALAILAPGAVVAGFRLLGAWDGSGPLAAWATVLAMCVLIARGHLFSARGFTVSAPASLAITAVILLAMRAGYARYGFGVQMGPSDGAWVVWGLSSVVRGVALEAWLRGAIFAPSLVLGGPALALVLSTVVGVALHAGQPQEIVFWHLFTCVGYGALRLWTRDAIGLGPARGLGDAVLEGLAHLR